MKEVFIVFFGLFRNYEKDGHWLLLMDYLKVRCDNCADGLVFF